MHTVQSVDFDNPRAPTINIRNPNDPLITVTVIADNPLSSCSYKLDWGSIEREKIHLLDHARKVGYKGIAQIFNLETGECVTFAL